MRPPRMMLSPFWLTGMVMKELSEVTLQNISLNSVMAVLTSMVASGTMTGGRSKSSSQLTIPAAVAATTKPKAYLCSFICF